MTFRLISVSFYFVLLFPSPSLCGSLPREPGEDASETAQLPTGDSGRAQAVQEAARHLVKGRVVVAVVV